MIQQLQDIRRATAENIGRARDIFQNTTLDTAMSRDKSPAKAGLWAQRIDALALVALMSGLHRDFGIPFFALVWHVVPHGAVFFDAVLAFLAFATAGLGAAARPLFHPRALE